MGTELTPSKRSVTYTMEVTGHPIDNGLYKASDTQLFHVGTRFKWRNKVFYYAQAGGTWNTDLLAQQSYTQEVAYATIAKAAAVGSNDIVLDVAATDGIAADGVIAEDYLVNGHLIIFPHDQNSMNRDIVANTAVASGGGEMTLTLDSPITVALTVDTDHGECMASAYRYVKASTTGDQYKGFLGLPMAPCTVGQYGWLQTWGPCWIAPQSDVGVNANNLQVVARYDGSIQAHDDTDTTYSQMQQHIGWVMSHASDNSQGAPFIYLQISR